MSQIQFESLVGKTITEIAGAEANSDRVELATEDGVYVLWHDQDCCESVAITQVDGDISDLLDSPLTIAEESSSECEDCSDSGTWTFYKLATVKGYVTLRWLGTSNGFYSERVSFRKQGTT